MRLHPRHYLLLGLIVLLGIWNFARLRRTHQPAALAPATNTPGWQAFDRAAGLRDAPDAQFTPALDTLRAQTESSTGTEAADLRGCQMWLLYYRHSVPMAGGKPGDWAMLATSHVQSCLTNHRDVGR
jgi:hypothetical protein